MVLPTEQDRALWHKATQAAEKITDEERRIILGLVDPDTQLSNSLEVSGMSPEELEQKALQNPESLTSEECRLIKHGYHIWDVNEAMADNKIMNWTAEDQTANIKATLAILTPHETAVRKAVRLRAGDLAKQKGQAMKIALNKAVDESRRPCAWVERLIDRSVPLNAIDKQPVWGFVILRDARTKCSNEAWDEFLKALDEAIFSGVFWLTGGEQINQTRKLVWQERFVDEHDRESLCREFQDTLNSGNVSSENILQTTFLLVTPEVVKSFERGSYNPWIWAYDTTFESTSSSNPSSPEPGSFNGRLKVAGTSIFTWFYAARSEDMYSMEQFWELAQTQPGQAWKVPTEMGIYHNPLVPLKRGTHYSFNTYQLRN